MINYKLDASNNITFPSKSRRVMLLIDGEYYRMDIKIYSQFSHLNGAKTLDKVELEYNLYNEEKQMGSVSICLYTDNFTWAHNMAKNLGYKEIPDDFFELERIEFHDGFRKKGLGTALLSYVINDIINFNKTQGKTIKILFERLDTKITLPFYKKFGARTNITNNPHNKYRMMTKNETTPMIIDEPKTCGEVPLELADDFNYEQYGYLNPFTKPAKRK